jgi:hypothetical protein
MSAPFLRAKIALSQPSVRVGGRTDVRCLALFSLFAGFRLARLLSVLPFLGRADIFAGWIAPGISRRSLKSATSSQMTVIR